MSDLIWDIRIAGHQFQLRLSVQTHLCVYLSWVSAGRWVCVGSWMFWPALTTPATSQRFLWHAVYRSAPAALTPPCRRRQWSPPEGQSRAIGLPGDLSHHTVKHMSSNLWVAQFNIRHEIKQQHGNSFKSVTVITHTHHPGSPCIHQSYRWWHQSMCTDHWAMWQPAERQNSFNNMSSERRGRQILKIFSLKPVCHPKEMCHVNVATHFKSNTWHCFLLLKGRQIRRLVCLQNLTAFHIISACLSLDDCPLRLTDVYRIINQIRRWNITNTICTQFLCGV